MASSSNGDTALLSNDKGSGWSQTVWPKRAEGVKVERTAGLVDYCAVAPRYRFLKLVDRRAVSALKYQGRLTTVLPA